jgi:hypothetical protein
VTIGSRIALESINYEKAPKLVVVQQYFNRQLSMPEFVSYERPYTPRS